MNFWGKIIGGFFGFLLGGPLGLFFGVMIGHMFDRGVQGNFNYQAQAQQAFFNATFLVMGYVAKADGRISEAEIQAARSVMMRMGLNEAQRQRAIELFNQGKQPDFNLDLALNNLIQSCRHNNVLLRMFVDAQIQASRADGALSPAKQKVLQIICQRLGIAPLNFSFFEDLFNFQQRYQQSGYQQQQHGYRPQQPSQLNLHDAYILLGIKETASDVEVKRAYRKQMSQHHPDKLVSKGLPEEMMKLATEKAQNIKAAYERICEVRGIK